MKQQAKSKAIVFGINASIVFALIKAFDVSRWSWWFITVPVAFTFIAAFIYINKKSRS